MSTIRWRVVEDDITGEEEVLSNARLVTWSDGSVQLLVGDQPYDLTDQDMMLDHNYLAAQLPGGLLQGLGHLTRRVQFRPAAGNSVSAVLRSVVEAKRQAGKERVKKTISTLDPERQKHLEAKRLEEEYRKQDRLKSRQTRQLDTARDRARTRAGITRDFLENNDNADYLGMGSDEEEEDLEDEGGEEARARQRIARGRPGLDEEQEREAERRIMAAKAGMKAHPGLAPRARLLIFLHFQAAPKRSRAEADDLGGFIVDDLGAGGGAAGNVSDDDEKQQKKRRGVIDSDDDE